VGTSGKDVFSIHSSYAKWKILAAVDGIAKFVPLFYCGGSKMKQMLFKINVVAYP